MSPSQCKRPLQRSLLTCLTPGLGVIVCGLCFGQSDEAVPCRNPKDFALKGFSGISADAGTLPAGLSVAARYCAGSGYALLAEELFDRGNLLEASRHVSNAIRLLEAEPANTRLLLGALRSQAAVHIERGMLSQASAVIEHLKTMPAELPEQLAMIHGLTAAYHQAAGDARSAEREYRLAIAQWKSIRRDYESVAEHSSLGVLYISSGRLNDAIIVLEHAKALLTGPGGRSEYYRVVVTNNLAVAYSKRGDTDAALRNARVAVKLVETARTGRFALEASVYSNCAAILRNAGHKKDASDVEFRAARAAAMANSVVDLAELGVTKRTQ